MSIVLSARVEPAVWPADRVTDVSFHLVLANDGDQEISLYPGAARMSDTGAGIAWLLRFRYPPRAPPPRSTWPPALTIRRISGGSGSGFLVPAS